MPTPPNLKRLPLGERLQDPLLVLDVEQKNYGDKDCTVLTLGNANGRIETAPFWGAEQRQLDGLGRNDIVQVIGEIGQFRGKRQLNISSIRALPRGSVAWRDLVPSIGDVAPWWDVLDRWRAEIRRPTLAAVLALFYDDPDFRERYGECPASPNGHHAELGGLLKHTVEVASIGRAMSKVCHADPDVVLAGAMLHDMGKLEAYSWNGAFETTECGALLGHVVLGSLMLERRLRAVDPNPCSDREMTLLQHLILSHHGKLEFGAAVPPMTLEAEVLHYADNASAKTASMADALCDPGNFLDGGEMSARRIWSIDNRRAFRGTSDWGLAEP